MQPPSQETALESHPVDAALPSETPSIKNITRRYGLICGAILIARLIISTAINMVLGQLYPQLLQTFHLTVNDISIIILSLSAFFTLLDWILYFLMGFFTTRRTRNVSSAIIAALWASLCYSVANSIITGINLVFTTLHLFNPAEIFPSILAISSAAFALDVFLLHIGLGSCIALLGGLLGRMQRSNRDRPPKRD